MLTWSTNHYDNKNRELYTRMVGSEGLITLLNNHWLDDSGYYLRWKTKPFLANALIINVQDLQYMWLETDVNTYICPREAEESGAVLLNNNRFKSSESGKTFETVYNCETFQDVSQAICRES